MGNNYIKLAKSLICEGRSRKITKNKFLDLYNSKAAAYSFEDGKIYRGVKGFASDFGVIDPRNYDTRESQYATHNFYTMIINNNSMWDDFPKREIVCSTSKKRASTYGDVYLMIPYNGVDWGICPNYDIFYSFPHLFEATSNKIDGMNRFNHFLKRIIGEEPKSYDSLTQHLDMFGKKFKETNFNKLISTSDFFREHKSFFMKYKNSPFYELGKFSAFIFSLMDPYSNDFEYQSKWNGAPNNREVWTDGRCLMIRRKTFERIKTELI